MVGEVCDYDATVERTITKMRGRDLHGWLVRDVVTHDYSIPDFAQDKVIKMVKEKLGIKD